MRYITNVVSDEYGRIMRWEELPKENEAGETIDYSDDENAVYIPDEAEETFDAYCGKKSKAVDNTVVTDMTLPEWKSSIVIENESKLTNNDFAIALAELGELVGGLINGKNIR